MTTAGARRLLILSCSARKKKAPGLLPAWELYQGFAFHVVRRAARDGLLPASTEILILSALHGIITPSTPLPYYDLRMTRESAAAQRRANTARLKEWTRGKSYDEVFLMMGGTYAAALPPGSAWCGGARVIHRPQSIGRMLQRLKRWVRGEPEAEQLAAFAGETHDVTHPPERIKARPVFTRPLLTPPVGGNQLSGRVERVSSEVARGRGVRAPRTGGPPSPRVATTRRRF